MRHPFVVMGTVALTGLAATVSAQTAASLTDGPACRPQAREDGSMTVPPKAMSIAQVLGPGREDQKPLPAGTVSGRDHPEAIPDDVVLSMWLSTLVPKADTE